MSIFVLLLVGALASSCVNQRSPSPRSTPSVSAEPSPTGAATTSVPTPPAGSPATGPCSPDALTAQVTGWTGAAGSRIGSVELRNAGTDPCVIFGFARPQLVDGAGTILIDGQPPGASMVLLLAPGGLVRADVRASNYCGPDPLPPVTVAFVLPDGLGRIVAAADSPAGIGGLPPCLGPGEPGTIEMQPWGA
jgi:hypothetical protein